MFGQVDRLGLPSDIVEQIRQTKLPEPETPAVPRRWRSRRAVDAVFAFARGCSRRSTPYSTGRGRRAASV